MHNNKNIKALECCNSPEKGICKKYPYVRSSEVTENSPVIDCDYYSPGDRKCTYGDEEDWCVEGPCERWKTTDNEIIKKMKCENCLYRKNCQFLSKHKNVDVVDCTAFVSETEVIKEAIIKFAEKLKANMVQIRLGGHKHNVITENGIDYYVKETVGE